MMVRRSEDRGLGALSRIGGVATFGAPATERVEEILAELHGVFPYDAGMISCIDPASGEPRALAVHGYPKAFREYMRTPAWHDEIVQPFGMPRSGWPVRERDLPVDPESIPSLA